MRPPDYDSGDGRVRMTPEEIAKLHEAERQAVAKIRQKSESKRLERLMVPAWQSESAKVYCGDALDVLKQLPAESVHCCVTSPPYFGLRDYGTGEWEGGSAECDHVQRNNKHGGTSNRPGLEAQTYSYRDQCAKCGARRIDRQIGLESTPEEFIARLVEVFREVRRVLHPTGTCWVNMGSSYASAAQPRKQSLDVVDSFVPVMRDENCVFALRDDLTVDETAYVLAELAAARKGVEVADPDFAVRVHEAVAPLADGK